MSDAPLDDLIGLIYEGVLTEDGWTDALKLIADLTGSVQASLIAMDQQTRHFSINENFNVAEAGLAEYNAYYHQHDPALDVVDSIQLGHWYHDRQHIGERVMRRSAFYQDFMRRHGLASVIANRLVCNEGTAWSLSLQRTLGQPRYDEAEMRNLDAVIPHLRRALLIRGRMQSLAQQACVSKAVLERLRLPLLVVDETGRLMLANAEAEATMHRQQAIRIENGLLRIDTLRPGRLEQLLRAACGCNGPATAAGAHVSGNQQQPTLQVIITPLPAHMPFVHAWLRPLALVVIQHPDLSQSSRASLLQQLYDLTLAEARVALAVLRGATPSGIAQQSGVSIATVRSQLKAVFLKTGTTRQAELIRMLSPVLMVGE